MPSKKLLKVYKSNELNQSNFSGYNLSVYRVLLSIITKIRRLDFDDIQVKNTDSKREYSLLAEEYSKEFKISKDAAYLAMNQAVKKLMETCVSFPVKRNDKEGILTVNVCESAFYEKNSGRIDIKFTESIMPHLVKLNDKFTMYNLCEISGFNSLYSTRLYELLMQYKTIGKLLISVEKLRYSLDCITCHKKYNDFKRFGFCHAVDEINSKYNINIKFSEIKKGKSVDSIEFNFKKTEVDRVYDPVTKKIRNQLTRPKKKKVEKKEKAQEKNPREAFSELAEKLRINKK